MKPPNYRAVLRSWIERGDSGPQIAERLGISLIAVRQRCMALGLSVPSGTPEPVTYRREGDGS